MKKIMFCGGGSAGHVIPNIAIIENLFKNYEVCYIGTDAIEKQICNNFCVNFNTYNGVKLVRGKILCNLSIPIRLYKSYAECKKIIEEEKPDLLFCKGGYASLPPALAAAKLKIPILTHESDMSAGLANKIIARRAERVLTSFPATAKKFRNGVFCGSPMRNCLFGRDKLYCKQKLGLDLRPTILVFGGGSGSKKINKCLRENLLELCGRYNILHVCGRNNVINNNLYGYRQLEFCDDMGGLYAAADYAVARCGSNSAHELIALKIPTLFIPLENSSSRGDQLENAEYFKGAGLCRVLREKELTADTLHSGIDLLVGDAQLKTALKLSRLECGNENIIAEIEGVIKKAECRNR